ncbi:MFS transporter [Thalassotalea sp. 42_200_T64]|nr:MFS transporter [Thalassotalea sp. 42_200_T64]
MFSQLDSKIKQYLIVTGNYWAFTLTDGALRMLVVLHFHQLGFGALDIALLFLFYEFFGVVTNLAGGWLGARIGLNRTMQIGLTLQVLALIMLTVSADMLTVAWVMAAQALSGIAKDLNKMSAKSSVKHLVPEDSPGKLFQWVALLTGSKNTLKGVGFFLGAFLLGTVGFTNAMWLMAAALTIAAMVSAMLLKQGLGRASFKPKFSDIFSKSQNINLLSLARMFLFAARDIWFVVALPVFLSAKLQWDAWNVGAFMASWVIAYGVVQGSAPKLLSASKSKANTHPAFHWGLRLTFVTVLLAIAMSIQGEDLNYLDITLIIGLIFFGICFAINSSIHSFLIVSLAKADGVSLDVGFYYMANAMGRLIGTILSGYLYQYHGLLVCLWGSAFMLLLATVVVKFVPSPQLAIIKR